MITKVKKVFCVYLIAILGFLPISNMPGLLNNSIVTKVLAGVEGGMDNWWFGVGNLPTDGKLLHVNNDKHSGNASARVIKTSENAGNHFLVLTRGWTPTEAGATYQFSFWHKSQGVGYMAAWGIGNDGSTGGFYGTSDGDVWIKNTYTFTVADTNQKEIKFLFEDDGSVWIDDVSIDKVNADLSLTNVLFDGFETNLDTSSHTSNVTGVGVVAGKNNLNLTWTNPSDSYFDGTAIYRVNDDNTMSQISTLTKTQNSFNVSGLNTGTTYKFSIKSLDLLGNLTPTGNVFTGTTLGVTITHPAFQKAGIGAITNIQSGNISSNISVLNQYSDDASVTLVMALYNGNNLVDIEVQSKNVSQTLPTSPQLLNASITVPELGTGNYYIKTMVWSDLTSLYPLIGATIVNNEGITNQSFTTPNTQKVNSMDNIANWVSGDGTATITADTSRKTEGYQSLKVSFAPNFASQPAWSNFTWSINPYIDFSNASKFLFDVYPLEQTPNGWEEPIRLAIYDKDNNALYESNLSNLTSNMWNTVSIDLAGMSVVNRQAIKTINIYSFTGDDYKFNSRTIVEYNFDNMRLK